ncbi:DMT family transporter [Solimonas flava]|uniref:DMT family transporter n=1 Tax=Solimonas flava TaxID=415849 RepID=UPI000421A3A0|nr:DMT family transporter [Solimonas flava]
MRNNLRRGALHALLAAAAFSITGVCIKAASATTPNEMVVFIRCFVSLLALLPWLLRRGRSAVRTTRLGGHLWRSAFGVAAMYCFFYAIAALPLASAMLLTYSTPLWLPFIAWAWIGERPPWIALPAAVIGLAGIALIVRPGAGGYGGLGWAGLIGLASGLLAACAMVSIRRISDSEPAERIVFYFALMATAISAIPLIWAWQTPTPHALALLIGAGIAATVGQLHLTHAYAWAPAARVGPFTYFSVLFSAVLAWLLWGERLDRWAALGALLVVLTCVLVSWRPAPPVVAS